MHNIKELPEPRNFPNHDYHQKYENQVGSKGHNEHQSIILRIRGNHYRSWWLTMQIMCTFIVPVDIMSASTALPEQNVHLVGVQSMGLKTKPQLEKACGSMVILSGFILRAMWGAIFHSMDPRFITSCAY